jgi:hypothetical protein
MILFFICNLLPGGMVNLTKGIKTDRLIQPEQGCLHLDSTNTTGTVRGPGILPPLFLYFKHIQFTSGKKIVAKSAILESYFSLRYSAPR